MGIENGECKIEKKKNTFIGKAELKPFHPDSYRDSLFNFQFIQTTHRG